MRLFWWQAGLTKIDDQHMAYAKLNDDELLVLLKQNNRAAYIEMYNRYWKKMLLVAWNYSRNDYIAQEVVQEVFINLWEKYHKYEIKNLQAFLCTAIKFQIFKHIQREQRRAELAKDNYHFEDISLDEEKLDARFLQDMINGIVEDMPEKCRMVFHYSRNLGLKNAEIAEKTNTSKKTVENNLNRALKIIRGELKNHGIPFIIVFKLLFSVFR